MSSTKDKDTPDVDLELIEGRRFTIGREGHIYIDSPTVSKQHAEIRIIGGKIYLRDLGSTNGTYLFRNKMLVYFEEGYVSSQQRIVIGNRTFTVSELLAIATDFSNLDDSVTILNCPRLTG